MKLRAVHLRDHPALGNLSLEFRTEGRVDDACWLVGGSGSGKSLVALIAAMGWGASMRKGGLPLALNGARARVDFEIGGEVAICQAQDGLVTGSPLLHEKWGQLPLMENSLLHYDYRRVMGAGSRDQPLGVRSVSPILADLNRGGIRDSVVVIDDFDLGLDAGDQRAFWAHLWKHHRSQGNQLIVTAKRGLGLAREIALERRENVVVAAEALLKAGTSPALL